jgi:hypothetical protein
MKNILVSLLLCLGLGACSTSTRVMVGGGSQPASVHSAALVSKGGNSVDMDQVLRHDLLARGLAVKRDASEGARQVPGVDAVVSYEDSWRWDLVMYLRSLDVSIFDAKSGALLVTGRWENSLFHRFPKTDEVVQQLMDAMYLQAGWSKPVASAH